MVVPEISPGQKIPPPRHLNEAAAFVNATLEKGIQGIVAEFKEEKKSVDKEKMKAFVENEKKNRYKVGSKWRFSLRLSDHNIISPFSNQLDEQVMKIKLFCDFNF